MIPPTPSSINRPRKKTRRPDSPPVGKLVKAVKPLQTSDLEVLKENGLKHARRSDRQPNVAPLTIYALPKVSQFGLETEG